MSILTVASLDSERKHANKEEFLKRRKAHYNEFRVIKQLSPDPVRTPLVASLSLPHVLVA
jgi:hypothetical protein